MILTYDQGITILQALDFKRSQVGLNEDDKALHKEICAFLEEDEAPQIEKEDKRGNEE